MSRISCRIWRKEELFELDHRGARYGSQLKEAVMVSTGVTDARKAEQFVRYAGRSLWSALSRYYNIQWISIDGFMTEIHLHPNVHLLIDKEAVLGLD